MENYTTQMDAARKGIVTPQMEIVAKKENMPVEKLMQLVAEGKVAICANKKHTCLNPEGIGSMLRTKINVNLGVSRDCKDYGSVQPWKYSALPSETDKGVSGYDRNGSCL